eukprot:TRINITY_DN22866_c0_g1_i1.p1 TRINITY_DN22866_c0_g1~~TRINITY_DN22866_c0_g1_i1.p1  ORF type:complete len:365 (+),score=148.57 TRINITY_DN22866_c0_g1_i1:123-1217(+)
MAVRRNVVLLMTPRKMRRNVRHWDLLHDIIEQDKEIGMMQSQATSAPWPPIPPLDIGTFEQEWIRYRNVAQLVANGAIQPPKWYSQSRLAPPTSGPFWGDPPVHSKEHQYPLRRHFWTANLKPPTELMKVFFLRKEDMVMDQNYKRVIGFSPKDKVRKKLKEDIAEGAAEGRSTFNFFWQKKPLEKMESRFYQLKESGVRDAEAHKMVQREFYETLAIRKRQQAIAAETARRSGKAISAYQGHWILDLLITLQQDQIDRSLADQAGMDLSVVVKNHSPDILHGRRPQEDDAEQSEFESETSRYLEYTGLQPDMMAFEHPVVAQHRPPIFSNPVDAAAAVEQEAAEAKESNAYDSMLEVVDEKKE